MGCIYMPVGAVEDLIVARPSLSLSLLVLLLLSGLHLRGRTTHAELASLPLALHGHGRSTLRGLWFLLRQRHAPLHEEAAVLVHEHVVLTGWDTACRVVRCRASLFKARDGVVHGAEQPEQPELLLLLLFNLRRTPILRA